MASYSWDQDNDLVTITIDLGERTDAKKISVRTQPTSLSVSSNGNVGNVGNVVFDNNLLNCRVYSDETMWHLDDGGRSLIIELSKQKKEWWWQLFIDCQDANNLCGPYQFEELHELSPHVKQTIMKTHYERVERDNRDKAV